MNRSRSPSNAFDSSRIAEPQSANPAILIVDDVPENLVALEAVLGDLDCQICSASSGEEALKLLLQQAFAVMILDVRMPNMDGFDVARHARMRSATRDLPIIFLTAALDSDEGQRAGYGAGAVDYLVKPVNRDVLRGKVRVFLELFVGRRRLTEVNPELGAMRESVERLVTVLDHRTGQGIKIHFEVGEPDLSASCFNQLLLNVVASALDALDGSGTVSIRTERRDQELVLKIAHAAHEPSSPSREPVDACSKATSSGISIASAIVKQHHGGLDVRQTPTATTVTVRIPVR